MQQLITSIQSEHDSIGGIITCVCRNVPVGLGEPCFDKLEAMLAHAMLSIPSTKGFEIGSGFDGTKLRGSQHNDMYIQKLSTTSITSNSSSSPIQLSTSTNRSGGIQGGISNGETIIFRVAFKPPATISMEQPTVDFNGQQSILKTIGRHDPCVVPRAIPIVEAMSALVLTDAILIQSAREVAARPYDLMGKIGAIQTQVQMTTEPTI
jgi:chorismate synthase